MHLPAIARRTVGVAGPFRNPVAWAMWIVCRRCTRRLSASIGAVGELPRPSSEFGATLLDMPVSSAANQLRKKALQLPVRERARLARDLLTSLDDNSEEGAEEAWRIEIERRACEVLDGTVVLEDGRQVLRELKDELVSRPSEKRLSSTSRSKGRTTRRREVVRRPRERSRR